MHPPTLGARAERAARKSARERYEVLLAEVPDAEDAKRVEVAAFCWQVMGQTDFTRTDAVIGFGGGATTDLAGFVAATWLRGVSSSRCPTTLLGMVDAAVGGKTGINTAEGKNLVGAFCAPAAVVVRPRRARRPAAQRDPRRLRRGREGRVHRRARDPRHHRGGRRSTSTDPHSAEFRRVIELAIAMKARVVGEDFREAGLREILNYGHTLGHAIEHAERYRWRHGAAVSVGMVFAAELGAARGLAARCRRRPAPRHPALARPADDLPGRALADAAGDHAARQEEPRRHAALHRARRHGQADGAAGPDESLLFAAYQEVGV